VGVNDITVGGTNVLGAPAADTVTYVRSSSETIAFALWLEAHHRSGDLAEQFAADWNGDGVADGFDYAFGTNWAAGQPLMSLLFIDGRPIVEVPSQDLLTTGDSELCVEGTRDLLSGGWTLLLSPSNVPTRTPPCRQWWGVTGTPPTNAFFRLRATLLP